MDANTMFNRLVLLIEGGKMVNRTPNQREGQDCLNLAQLQIIKERYAKWKNRPQLGYGDSEVRNSELAGLLSGTARITSDKFLQGTPDNGALPGPNRSNEGITYNETTNTITYTPGLQYHFGVFVPIPDEAVYVIYEYGSNVRRDVTNVGTSYKAQWNVPVRQITFEQYNNEIYNYYKQPYEDTTWSIDWGSFTPGALTGGEFANSTKEYSDEGTNFNMQGFSFYGNTSMSSHLVGSVYTLTVGNWYRVVATTATPQVNYVTYPTGGTGTAIKYNGEVFQATTALGTSAIKAGDAVLLDCTVNVNTRRSKYVLTGSNCILSEYAMNYLKIPSDIRVNLITPDDMVNCQLADFLHDEIVKKAVEIYCASIVPEPNKFEVNKIQSKETE